MRFELAIPMLLLAGGCADREQSQAPQPASTPAVVATSASVTPDADHFSDAIRDHADWSDVYTTLRIAPMLCDASVVSGDRTSDAPEGSPHGRKVYELKVSDLRAFLDSVITEPPIGFTAVKVAYAPNPDSPSVRGEFMGLFLMKRIAESWDTTTDQGWVYATTDASLRIIDAGRIDSCMRCHADAPYGRLFGPQEQDQRSGWN